MGNILKGIEMLWNNYILLSYRFFIRQHEDGEGRLAELVGRLSETSMGELEEIEYDGPYDTYWPVRGEDIDDAEDRGLLVTTIEGKPNLVVRIFNVKILVGQSYEGEESDMLDEVAEAVGLDQFIVVQVIREMIQDKQAL